MPQCVPEHKLKPPVSVLPFVTRKQATTPQESQEQYSPDLHEGKYQKDQ